MINFIVVSFCLFSTSVFAENISFKLERKNLKVSGQVTSQTNKPIFISGFDLSGKPYKLEITREPNKTDLVRVGYVLDRNGGKESGSIIIQKGKLAQIESKHEDPKNPALSFDAMISE